MKPPIQKTGNIQGSRTSVTLPGLGKRTLTLGLTVFALSIPALAQQSASTIGLRGADPVLTEYSSKLRGTNHAPHAYTEADYHEHDGLGADLRLGLRYAKDNFLPLLVSRGVEQANSDRDIDFQMSSRSSLRQSLMHSANVYEGLRGGAASVGDTVASSLRGSYVARAELERAAADKARVYGALAAFLPRISASVNAQFSNESSTTTNNQSFGILGTTIEASVPLYTSGVNLNNYRRARHVSLASDYRYLAQEQRVGLEAVAAHVNLRLNRRIEKTIRGNVSAAKHLAHITRKLFQAGDASRTDIAIADANVERAKSELEQARRTREQVADDYASLTSTNAPKKLSNGHVARLIPANVDDAVEMAMRNNPLLAQSLHEALASRYAAKAEWGRFGPQVDLFGNYRREANNVQSIRNDNEWNVGIRLRIPVFDAALIPSVGAARHASLEAQYRSLDQSRLIEKQVRQQWSAYQSAKRQIKIADRQVKAVKTSFDGSQREFKAGYRSLTDVLNDQILLARAEIALDTALHQKILVAYELAFTTGNPALRDIFQSHRDIGN